MSRVSPVPWRRDGTHVIGADNQVVAVCRQARPRNTNEAMRNATLIAAAPELLAALKGVVAVADRKTGEFDAAHDAIASAEAML